MRILLPVIALVIGTGCAQDAVEADADTHDKTIREAPETVLILDGPGGSIGLGDTLEAAKAAFPPPEGAEEHDGPLSFGFVSDDSEAEDPQGWAWMHEETSSGFEVALEDGAISAIAYTRPIESAALIEEQRSAFGPPSTEAENDDVSLLSWVTGDNARFLLAAKSNIPFGKPMSMVLIGNKDLIKAFGFDWADPESMIRKLEEGPSEPTITIGE